MGIVVFFMWRIYLKWQTTPVLLSGESHGWRSLVGYSPRGCTESDTTERLQFHFTFFLYKVLWLLNLDTGMREVEEFKFLPEVAVYSLGTVVWSQVLHWSLTILILNLLTNCEWDLCFNLQEAYVPLFPLFFFFTIFLTSWLRSFFLIKKIDYLD